MFRDSHRLPSTRREQQARLFESGGLLHAEPLPVSGTSLAQLDQARLADYLVNLVGDDRAPTAEAAWHERLLGLGFMTAPDTDALPVCTVAGLLLFGRAPRRYLRQAGIRWMSFASESMDYEAQEDAIIDGPLVALREGVAGSSRPLIEGGLVERLEERMRPFISREAAQPDQHFRRERQYRYPPEAVREAVLNALIHRDWTRPTDVEVVNYSSRLEVTSPGMLQNSMTLQKMLAGQRSPRNPIMTEVMRDYGYVDMRGMGVRRKIVPLTRAWSGQDAGFELTDDYLRVTLPAKVIGFQP